MRTEFPLLMKSENNTILYINKYAHYIQSIYTYVDEHFRFFFEG